MRLWRYLSFISFFILNLFYFFIKSIGFVSFLNNPHNCVVCFQLNKYLRYFVIREIEFFIPFWLLSNIRTAWTAFLSATSKEGIFISIQQLSFLLVTRMQSFHFYCAHAQLYNMHRFVSLSLTSACSLVWAKFKVRRSQHFYKFIQIFCDAVDAWL